MRSDDDTSTGLIVKIVAFALACWFVLPQLWLVWIDPDAHGLKPFLVLFATAFVVYTGYALWNVKELEPNWNPDPLDPDEE